MKTFRLRWILLSLLLLGQGRAAELRFLFGDLAALSKWEFFLGDPDRIMNEPLSVYPIGRGIPVNTDKGSFLLRVRPQGDPAAEIVEFSVKVDPAIKKGLVVLLPDAQSRAGVRGEVFEYDSASFAKGSYRFLNASKRAWTVDMDGQRTLLPAQPKPVDIKPAGEARMKVALAPVEEPLKPRYVSLWAREEGFGLLVILLPGKADGDPPELKIFPLELPPK